MPSGVSQASASAGRPFSSFAASFSQSARLFFGNSAIPPLLRNSGATITPPAADRPTAGLPPDLSLFDVPVDARGRPRHDEPRRPGSPPPTGAGAALRGAERLKIYVAI